MLLGAVNYNRFIAYAILALYVAMMVVITVLSRKKSRSLNDFLLAGKGLGGWITALAYGTTYFSAVVFIGYAGKFGWGFGLAALWIGVGNALIGSLLAWLVFAKRTRNMTKGLQVKTMPELFEARYQSKNIRLVSAIVMFVFLIPYSASVYQGLAFVFESVLGIKYLYCVLAMAALTALYLFFGGYFASAMSNFVQAIIMFVGVLIMMVFIMHKGGWGEAITRLTEMDLGFWANTSSDTGFFNSNFFNLGIIFLLTSVGICGLPQSVHKFYAIRDNAAIKKATVVSTVFALVIAGGAYFMGGFARLFTIDPSNPDLIMPQLFELTMPAAFMGFIAVLIFAASMSTLAALALAGSSAVAVDFYKGYANKRASDKNTNMVMKIMCVVYIAVSVLLAVFKIEAIVALMGISWGTLAGCFIGPYFYGLYSKKATKGGAWASIVASLVVTFGLFTYFGITKPAVGVNEAFLAFIKGGLSKSPLIGVIAMAVSFIITPLVSSFTKKPDAAHVEKVFSFVKKGVIVDSDGCIVTPNRALEDAEPAVTEEAV